MLPCENQAAKTGRPRPGARGDLLGAIETIISALMDIAAGDSAASENSANHSDGTRHRAETAGLQATIVVCAQEDGLALVNRGRAVFAREYLSQLFETMAGLMAEGRRSLAHAPSQSDVSARAADGAFEPAAENCFQKKGMYWTLAYQGRETLVADGKGLQYLAQLLRHPGREVHVLDLAACSNTAAYSDARDVSPAAKVLSSEQWVERLRAGSLGDAGAHLDARAKSAYKRRLTELREELAEAKQFGNEQQALALEQDIDALLGELRRAIGLRGRDRKAASPAERARVNVTRTIKLALEHIGRVHPELETHLAASVKTGTFCRYQPDPHELVNWRM
jgi:hypothetical protein